MSGRNHENNFFELSDIVFPKKNSNDDGRLGWWPSFARAIYSTVLLQFTQFKSKKCASMVGRPFSWAQNTGGREIKQIQR